MILVEIFVFICWCIFSFFICKFIFKKFLNKILFKEFGEDLVIFPLKAGIFAALCAIPAMSKENAPFAVILLMISADFITLFAVIYTFKSFLEKWKKIKAKREKEAREFSDNPKLNSGRIENINIKITPTYNVSEMEGHDFEYFCGDVLSRGGYNDVEVTRGSGDQGVDILAKKDGIKYAFQCKRFAKPVGNKAVQEISAGKQFYGCHVGVIITNSRYTPSAIELAKATGTLLWNGDYLMEFARKRANVIIDNNIPSYPEAEPRVRKAVNVISGFLQRLNLTGRVVDAKFINMREITIIYVFYDYKQSKEAAALSAYFFKEFKLDVRIKHLGNKSVSVTTYQF